MTADELFKELGGAAAVGRIIGVSTEHAATMRRRGSIPIRYWNAILAQAKLRKMELTMADLAEISQRKAA